MRSNRYGHRLKKTWREIDMLKGTRRGRAKKNWVYCVSEEIAKNKKN